MPQNNAKDTIYIDVDDEITAVIEKVQASGSKIVALVLPKRAAIFQSTVNMRLLKRSADNAKKNLVLITSEASLLPLAGIVGLHVAKTLQSKPEIPAAPSNGPSSPADDEAEVVDDVPPAKPDPAGLPPEEDTIEVDNSSPEDDPPAKGKKDKKSYNKKLKVPNFNKFKMRLLIGAAVLVLLITGWIFAAIVLPKATVTIQTDTTDVRASVSVVASPRYTQADADADPAQVSGKLEELKKTDSQKAAATGKKDVGTKASGSVTLSLNDCSKEVVTVPAGTTVSAGNFNFITQSEATMQSVKIGSNCRNDDFPDVSTAKVKVIAQNAGDSYNLSARSYSVAGHSNVSGAGGAMSGGVSKVITVVSQQDIDGLRQKIIDGLNGSANQDITKNLKDGGFFPLTETFTTKDPVVTANPAVDTEAGEVSVSVAVTYTMIGAKHDDLSSVLDKAIEGQIDTTKQKILDNGMNDAGIRIEEKQPDGTARFSLDTTAKVGVEPNNEKAIKEIVAGKKKGDAKSLIQSRPGVKDVTIDTSPFWVSKIPKNQNKITIIFKQQ